MIRCVKEEVQISELPASWMASNSAHADMPGKSKRVKLAGQHCWDRRLGEHLMSSLQVVASPREAAQEGKRKPSAAALPCWRWRCALTFDGHVRMR
jgi:hypothetical protein